MMYMPSGRGARTTTRTHTHTLPMCLFKWHDRVVSRRQRLKRLRAAAANKNQRGSSPAPVFPQSRMTRPDSSPRFWTLHLRGAVGWCCVLLCCSRPSHTATSCSSSAPSDRSYRQETSPPARRHVLLVSRWGGEVQLPLSIQSRRHSANAASFSQGE